MAERGRPSVYTDEIAREILDRLAHGESLLRICRSGHLPAASTVRSWALNLDGKHDEFSAKYATARRIGYDLMAEEILDISDDSSEDVIETEGGPRMNSEYVARSRIRIDTRKWLLSKVLPKIYGDKILVGEDPEAPIKNVHTIQLVGVAPQRPQE